jgi:hypothetical protein
VHAEVVRFDHDCQPVRLHHRDEQVRELDDRLFLNLRPRHHPVGDSRILRQPDQVRILVRHHSDPQLAHDRAQVVAARAAQGNGPHDHELVEMRGIGKLRDLRRRHVSPAKHLEHVHLRDAARGLARVVIAFDVDDEAVQHREHLRLDFLRQRLELAGLDECRDVVVGVEAPLRGHDSLANPV